MTVLTITRGDDVTLDIFLTDKGQPVDLTGAQLWWTAKRRHIDLDSLAVIQKTLGAGITITQPTQGKAEVALVPNDTAALESIALWWDLQGKDGAGKVRTLAAGRLVVEADVTRTTA